MSEHALTDGQTVDTSNDTSAEGHQGEAGYPADSGAPEDHAERERAQALGWQDKTPFVERGGKETAWVNYDEFLRTHDRLMPMLRKENKKLERQLTAKSDELASLRKEVAQLRKFQEELAQSRTEVDESALWSERQRALETGDHAEVNKIDRQLHNLRSKAPAKTEPPPQQEGPDPSTRALLEEFADDNPIYRNNPKMQGVLAKAMVISAQADPTLRGRELLDDAHETAKRLWGQMYQTTAAPRKAPMAETNDTTPARARNGARVWSDLKPDVAQALDQWIESEPAYMKMGKDKARARLLANAKPEQFRSR